MRLSITVLLMLLASIITTLPLLLYILALGRITLRMLSQVSLAANYKTAFLSSLLLMSLSLLCINGNRLTIIVTVIVVKKEDHIEPVLN